jgi:hypothetical protein
VSYPKPVGEKPMNSLICLPANETGGPSGGACAAALAMVAAAMNNSAADTPRRNLVLGVIMARDPRR